MKPISGMQLQEIFKERNIQLESHKKFTNQFGGKVFYIYSIKQGDKKIIANKEIIDDIRQEINRLL